MQNSWISNGDILEITTTQQLLRYHIEQSYTSIPEKYTQTAIPCLRSSSPLPIIPTFCKSSGSVLTGLASVCAHFHARRCLSVVAGEVDTWRDAVYQI